MSDERSIVQMTGSEREDFLQGLVTNDLTGTPDLSYTALLTPQGKFLVDFFVLRQPEALLIDVATPLATGLVQRLSMYKLRADVQITPSELSVQRGLGTPPQGALPDPRHPALGWRLYTDTPGAESPVDWDAIRVEHCIPETGIELIPNDTFILEAGFERLHGVNFRKGCFIGQEVTARMKHKTELRKGLTTVSVDGTAPVGTPITADGKTAGTLFTQSGGRAIAYLRFDRAGADMQAGEATVHWHG